MVPFPTFRILILNKRIRVSQELQKIPCPYYNTKTATVVIYPIYKRLVRNSDLELDPQAKRSHQSHQYNGRTFLYLEKESNQYKNRISKPPR